MGTVANLGSRHGSLPQNPRFKKNQRASSTNNSKTKKDKIKHSREGFHGTKTKTRWRRRKINAHKDK